MTWGMTVASALRCSEDADGGTGGAEVCWGAPHRVQAGAETGFMPPHDAQRMYRTVPCSGNSALMVYSRPEFEGFSLP
jgi:hypothetical protein